MALVTLVYSLAGFPPHEFGVYCTTLIAAAGIFSGSAVAERFAAPKV